MRGWLRAVIGSSLALGLLACGGGGGGSDTPGDVAPLAFAPFAEAEVVFGQPIFGFNDQNQGFPSPGAGTLACPGIPAVGPLFVPDEENHRVLGFAQTPILNNLDASFVLGQPDAQFAIPGVGATAMRGPTAATIAAGRLLVSDTGNNRILVYDGVPTRKGVPAAFALGQPDLVSGGPGTGDWGLNAPAGVAYGGGRLVVADRGNHRVLVWNTMPTSDGQPASLVLGQADFGTTRLNRGGPVGRDTMFDPYGVWTDGTRLVVADRGNHRVLVWHTFPTSDGQPADVVLGQRDGATRIPADGVFGLENPCGVDAQGDQLFVADAGNHRVLIWNSWPTADQQGADAVLGQADFDHDAPNDADQDAQEDAESSARTFKSKHFVLTVRVAGRTLFVGDTGNHRLLVFEGR